MDSIPHTRSLNKCFSHDNYVGVIFLLSTFAGIFPCRFRNGQFFASIPLCVWSFLAMCTASFSLVYFNINVFRPNSSVKLVPAQSITQVIVSSWHGFVFWVLYLIAVTNSIMRMREMNRILFGLHEVDRQLALLEIRKCWCQQAKYFTKTYLGGVAVTTLCYFNFPLLSIHILLKVYIFLPFICVWLCAAQFISLADLITHRLDETCAKLNDIVLTRHFSISGKKLNTLTLVQDKLCDIYVILDSSWGWIITCVISACFNGVFIPLYIILTTASKDELNKIDADPIGVVVSWIVFSIYTIWQIVSTTSVISMKMRGFNLTLYKLMMSDKRNEVLQNSKLRLHITMQREAIFIGKGFFKLDFTVIQWVVASATTYLVILIQFTPTGEEMDSWESAVNITTPFPVSSI